MPRADAQPRPAHQDRHGREPYHHHRQPPLEALPAERCNLRGVVEHDGHDGGVVVAEDVEAHVSQPHAHVVAVVPQRPELPSPNVRAVHAHDDPEGGQDLLAHDWGEGVVEDAPRALGPEVGDRSGVGCDVAPHAPEGLGEGSHEDVNVGSIDPGVLAAAATGGTHCPDGVSLVQV